MPFDSGKAAGAVVSNGRPECGLAPENKSGRPARLASAARNQIFFL